MVENVLDKICNKTHKHLASYTLFFLQSWSLWNNVRKYGRAWQDAEGNKHDEEHKMCDLHAG
jgi:hypothetical protein